MRAFYRAEDYLDEMAYMAARPIYRRTLMHLGWLAGRMGDLLGNVAR